MPNPNVNRRVVLSGYSSPVTNFINATGITDATTINALTNMYNSLVGAGLYSKFYALYPMVGGTSTTTKFNFIDPRDTDNAYRITWSGGLTFASTGVTPNGTNGFGNTHFIDNTAPLNNLSVGTYSRTDVAAGPARASQCGIGTYSVPNSTYIYLGQGYGVNTVFGSTGSIASATTKRHFGVSRSNDVNFLRVTESVAAAVVVSASSASTSTEINIFRLGGFGGDYDVKESAFNYISMGFTQTEFNSLTTIIDTFQTALSRNV